MRSDFKAVIYDMDGVLINSEPLAVASEREVCKHHGIEVPRDAWKRFKGMRSTETMAVLLREFATPDLRDRLSVEDLVAQRREAYLRLADESLSLFPGALECLAATRRAFSKVGLATSSSLASQRHAFGRFGLDRYFHAVVTAENVRVGKPDPEAYLAAAQRLGVAPADCAVIEDSDNGVRAAVAAGCYVVGITHSFPARMLRGVGADEVVEQLLDIPILFRDQKKK